MHKGSRSGKWLRKAGGLFPPTPFRARRAVSVTSVVQNAVLYIGIENAFWVNKSCRKAKDSFNGLKHKSALNRHAAVHWMDTTASIQLKFMRPLDGQTRYNPIETCVSMGWTQRPPPRPASRRFHPPLSRTRTLYQNRRARIKRGGGKVGKWNGGKVAAIRCRGGYAGYVSRNPSTDGSMGLLNHAPGIAKPPNLHDIADHDIIDGEVSNVYAVVNIACIWIRIVCRKGKRCIKAIQNSPLGIIPQPLRCIRIPQPERDVPNSLGYLIVKLRRILKSKPAAQHPRSPASQKTPLRVTFALGSRGKSANIPKAVPYRCRNPNRQENIYNLPQA